MDGRILKQLREARRITQDEMANALHVTKRAYAGWERGERDVSTDTLCQPAKRRADDAQRGSALLCYILHTIHLVKIL